MSWIGWHGKAAIIIRAIQKHRQKRRFRGDFA